MSVDRSTQDSDFLFPGGVAKKWGQIGIVVLHCGGGGRSFLERMDQSLWQWMNC